MCLFRSALTCYVCYGGLSGSSESLFSVLVVLLSVFLFFGGTIFILNLVVRGLKRCGGSGGGLI